jgi:hypothetical protein
MHQVNNLISKAADFSQESFRKLLASNEWKFRVTKGAML